MTWDAFTKYLPTLSFSLLITLSTAHAQERDVFELPLEDIANLEVSSVTTQKHKITDTPAAVFVITQDDIRRSGATTIPELFRIVPGMQVARLNSHEWAITSRGFNSIFADKLLVLIDGRTVYTPVFSGVFWSQQDTLLEDIDRIEVIRGPGATIWGANAVNGVVNIVTKNARETVGRIGKVGYGSEDQGYGSARIGTELGKDSFLRVYGQGFNRDESTRPEERGESKDDWQRGQGGFRYDRGDKNGTTVTVQGDAYGGNIGYNGALPDLDPPDFQNILDRKGSYNGANLLTQLDHPFSSEFKTSLRAYIDRVHRREGILDEKVETYDLNVTNNWKHTLRSHLTFGSGYRIIDDELHASQPFGPSFVPEEEERGIFNAFAQHEYEILSNELSLMIGTKYENDDKSISAFQPGARLLWKADDTQSVWTSWSRAVRTPSRVDRTVRLPFYAIPDAGGGLTGIPELRGNPDFSGEEVFAYEIGYRVIPYTGWSIDVATFYNDYAKIRTFDVGTPSLSTFNDTPFITIPAIADSKNSAESYGVELSSSYRVSPSWKVDAWYTFTAVHSINDGSQSLAGANEDEDLPRNAAFIRSQFNFGEGWELDLTGRYVDAFSGIDIGSCIEMDARLAYHVSKNLSFALVGQNLLHESHREFTDFLEASPGGEIQRAVLGEMRFKF